MVHILRIPPRIIFHDTSGLPDQTYRIDNRDVTVAYNEELRPQLGNETPLVMDVAFRGSHDPTYRLISLDLEQETATPLQTILHIIPLKDRDLV
jgi:hypothetical protein